MLNLILIKNAILVLNFKSYTNGKKGNIRKASGHLS